MPTDRTADKSTGVPVGPMRLPDQLLAKSGFVLVRLAMGFKERALAELDKAGYGPHQYSVLAVLDEQARKVQATIADALGVDPSQLVGILDSLEDRGLIERERDPDDRRRHVISLTAQGRSQLGRLRRMIDKLEDEWFTPLSPAERRTFHELLLRLAAQHDPHTTDAPCT